MKDGDSVTKHLNAFNTVLSQLSSVDIKISDEDKCISLLYSLPDSWDSLVIAIGSNASVLQFDEIVSSLLTEEMIRKNMESQNGDALSVRGWSQNRNKNTSSSGRSKSPGKPTKVVCWKCGKEGHFRRECKSKAPDKGKGSDDAPSADAKTTSDEGGDVYLASSSTHVDHEAWLIDSGDDRKARIIGRGKVKLKLQGGRVRTLSGVLHIPALARNLISVSKLDDVGVKTVFEKDTCKMVRGALVLMRGVRIGTLYKLQGSTIVDGCNSSMVPENGAENLVVSGEKTMLWHQRLGHIGEKGLRILHGNGMVEGMSNSSLDFDFCENCVYGKQNRKTTPYTPQQNGVAERMNKTLIERARSMLSGAGLGQEFWAEAVDTACYLVNRSPLSTLEDKTPQEVWTGKKPSLSHLRVFGCDAYVHVPELKRTKLDSKSQKCIFIGEVKDFIKHEFQPKEPVKIEFELKEEESNSIAEEESEDEEPQTPAEAVDLEDGKLWKEAMIDEMASLHKNEAWDLVELPTGRKPIGSKWVFKKKTNAVGKVKKYKARLVAKGYSQVPRIDFGDIFSPVVKVASIRLLLSVAAAFDFEVEQMDVKTTFLHGDLEEEIYMKQPEGFGVKDKKELVCK
eukprot:PITA_27342